MFIREDLELALDMASDHVRSISYTSPVVRTVGVLAAFVSHSPKAFGHVPRVQITGGYGCGKSTLLDALQPIIANPSRHAGQSSTRFAIRNVYRDSAAEGLQVPSLIMDETSHTFGPTGKKEGGPIYTILTEGYSKNGAPVVFQEKDQNAEYSCYQVAFLASRHERSLPEDVIERSIRLTLTKKPRGMELADVTDPEIIANGEQIGEFAASALQAGKNELRILARDTDWFAEYGLDSRDADKWIPLFAVAKLAGGNWPELVKAAYAELGSKTTRNLPTMLQIKADVLAFMNKGHNPEAIPAKELITYLQELGRKCYEYDEAPFTIKRYGMTLKSAGVDVYKSHSTVYYCVSETWLKQAERIANPVVTETHDPENEWDSLLDLVD